MPDKPGKFGQFWQEFKRRRLFGAIAMYSIAAYVIIELSSNVVDPLNLPEWTPTLIIVLLIVGFPFAIIFSWIFDITAKGIKKTEQIDFVEVQRQDIILSDKISWFEKSIAVLPFQDMSPNKDQGYFCDGMTEEIINALTHIESLKVIARTSAFAFKDKHIDIREIGKKLGVETLLEGSIRKSGNRLRITAQLVKVADGSHFWSDVYNREMEDVFAIQEEISLAIADNLKVKLLGKEKAEIGKRQSENLEAYNLYFKGNYYWKMLTGEEYKKAIESYEQALRKDPNFALVYYGLGEIYGGMAHWGNVPPNEAYPKAKEYLKKALEIDNTLAEAHCGLGVISMFFEWNWETAEQEIKQALSLNPNSAMVHLYYSWFFTFKDRYEEAISEANRALELDPLSGFINTVLGHEYLIARMYDKAIEKQLWTITMYPKYFLAHFHLGHAYRGKSMIDEAIEEYEKAVDFSGGYPLAVSWLACAYFEIGRKEKAEELIDSLEQRLIKEYVPPICFIPYQILRGDHDQALMWLETSINAHDSFLNWNLSLPIEIWRIPDEPGFKALLKKVGLE